MTLEQALAVHALVKNLGDPTEHELAAKAEAARVISIQARRAIDEFNSTPSPTATECRSVG